MIKRIVPTFFVLLMTGFLLQGCGITTSDYEHAILDGVANLNTQKPEEALADFNRAIDLDPNQAGGYVGRANALNTLGRYHEAIEDYDRAISMDPSIANAYVNRAIAHSHLNEYEKAIADYEKGLELDPKIDDPPGFVKRLFENVPNKDKGIRKHLQYLKEQVKKEKAKLPS